MPELAHLRIDIFKDYPYLYDGDLDNEFSYLKTYLNCSLSHLILAKHHDQVVGCSTAIPLDFESAECQQPFLDNNLAISKIFYFGESVLYPQYRGQGIYRQFFYEREKAAKNYGCEYATFCAILRNEADPRKPKNFIPLDQIWQHFGYEKQPHLCTQYLWKELGDTQTTPHQMMYWVKKL